MTYTDKHLDQIDAELSRPGRNGDFPKLSQKLSSDPELKAAAEDVELLWQATRLERLQGKLEMLKEYEEEAKAKAEAKEDKKIQVVSMRRMRWILSAAAGVLLLVAVGWWMFRDQGPQEIKNEYLAVHFEDYIRHDVTKGGETGKYTVEQLRAYNTFQIKNFKKAKRLLDEQWKLNNDELALFYSIVSRVSLDEDAQAKDLFQNHYSTLTTEHQALLDKLLTN